MEGACAEVGAGEIRRVRGSNGGRAGECGCEGGSDICMCGCEEVMEGDRGKVDAREIRRMRGGDGGRAREGGCEGGSDVCVCVCVCVCEGANGDPVDAREASFCACACAME